jgi:hypothetical protein
MVSTARTVDDLVGTSWDTGVTGGALVVGGADQDVGRASDGFVVLTDTVYIGVGATLGLPAVPATMQTSLMTTSILCRGGSFSQVMSC